MAKKTRKAKKATQITYTDIVYAGVLGLNFLSLYIHNLLLPWLYLFLVVSAVFLYEDIRQEPKIGHWLAIGYSPVLVSLYYLDFALSCATLLVLGLAHYYVLKERN